MTNNTQLVSVPLYATEEMKRAGMERMAQAQRDGSASLYAYAAVCWEAMIECYQERAAPAEDVRDCPNCKVCVGSPFMPKGCVIDNGQYAKDVRAVGEEPVAWRVTDHAGLARNYDHFPHWAAGYLVEPLYRRPQRPVTPQCSEVTGQCSEHLRTQGRPVVLPECPSGYGHGGTWCGPEYNCWLDRRPKVNK